MLRNNATEYGSVSKFFHWIIAAIVMSMLIFGFFMDDTPQSMQPIVYMIHKSFGLSVLALGILFICWSAINPKPKYPSEMPKWQMKLAYTVKIILYLALILMPTIGWVFSTAADKPPKFFGLWTLAAPGIPINKELATIGKNLHVCLAYVIVFVVALHIAGALKHHFIDHDNTLTRMLKRKKK